MAGRLDGKTAIVFGAGPNIGGTIALYFAREGAAVAVVDRDARASQETASFIQGRGFDASAYVADAMDETAVAGCVDRIVEKTGRLDAIVNMAGEIYWSSVLDMDVSRFRHALASFPTAGLVTTKHSARAMIATGTRGSIIHILSTAAHFGEADGAAYCASKAALLNLARSAAMDVAHDGIRVNTITPCAMEHQLWTARSAELFDPAFKPPKTRAYRSRDEYLKQIPLERFPRASDIAGAAVFLASDESQFITAADIPVDGGLRYKYPTWTPANFTGVNLADYAASIDRQEYGEPTTPLRAELPPRR